MCLGNCLTRDRIDRLSTDIRSLDVASTNENLLTQCSVIEQTDTTLPDCYSKVENLNVIHLNIHSLPAKRHDLNDLLNWLDQLNVTIHVVLLCETYISDLNLDLCKITGFNLYYKNRVDSRGGGVAILVRENIPSTEISITVDLHKEKLFECILCELKINNRKIIVCEIYRPPNSSVPTFLTKYETLVKYLHDLKCISIIVGDFNLDLYNCKLDKRSSAFVGINI